jgi:hypothetical protein
MSPFVVAISSSEPFWRRLIFTGKFLGMSLFARHWVHKLESLVSTFQERYFSEFCLEDKHHFIENGPKLFQKIDEALVEFRYSYRVHYQTSSCSGISNTFLTMLIGESSVAGVLSGIGGVDSADVLKDLFQMTRLLEEDPTMRYYSFFVSLYLSYLSFIPPLLSLSYLLSLPIVLFFSNIWFPEQLFSN